MWMGDKSELQVGCQPSELGNTDMEFALSKAILISLHEHAKITLQQYNYAIELLEKKYRQR